MLRQVSGPEVSEEKGNSTLGIQLSWWLWPSLAQSGAFELLLVSAYIGVVPEGLIPRGENTNSVEEGKKMLK